MKRFFRSSLFTQNIGLLVCLIVFGQISASLIFFHFSQRPRMDAFATLAAREIMTVRNTLAALPPAAKQTFIEQINAGGALTVSTSTPADIDASAGGLVRVIDNMVEQGLVGSGIRAGFTAAPKRRLVATWRDGDTTWWATFPDLPLAAGSPAVWLTVSCLIGLLSLAGAFLIQKRLHRPLDELAAAAAQVGKGHVPPRLDDRGPREIAVVAHGFNQMVANLREIEEQRVLMLAGVSHDLRTPLTKLRLALGILEGHIEDALAHQMIRSIEEMDRLLEQFLDFARVKSDEPYGKVDLRVMVLDSLAATSLPMDMFQLEALEAVIVSVRPRMMGRVCANLIDNAIKYGQASKARPIEVRTSASGRFATLEVLDRGDGFGEATFAQMTRPFARGTHGPGIPGSGLGLAIVARILEVHGGKIDAYHREGGGTAIRVRLPLEVPPELAV